MKRLAIVLFIAVVAVGIVAADTDRPPKETSRYIVTVVELAATGDAMGTPLRIEELGTPADAILPTAPNLATDGFVGAVPHSDRILAAIRQRGSAEVLYRGELETTVGRKGTWISGTQIPVPIVSLRGDARTVSTTFVKTGVKFEVEPRPGDHVNLQFEFSAATRVHDEVGSVVRQFSSYGTSVIPDGYTAIHSYLDRVPAEVLEKMPAEMRVTVKDGKDLVSQYFVLVTRMDLARSDRVAEKEQGKK